MENKNWYPVNNVSFLYATLKNKKRQNVFRFSCELIDNIDRDYLQIALRETLKVYPNYHLCIKTGFFNYYFESSPLPVQIVQETQPICHKLMYNDQDLLYEVSYYNNRINFEVSHILVDAGDATKFFKLLVSNYVKYFYDKQYTITSSGVGLQKMYLETAQLDKSVAELTNNYKNVYKYNNSKYTNATSFFEIHTNIQELVDAANSYGVELPTFLLSIIIKSMLMEYTAYDLNKRVKIELPVDLRTFSESNASQNCFDIFYIDYVPSGDKFDFRDIISMVDLQLKAREDNTSGVVANHSNVSFQKFISAKKTPLFIKKMGVGIIYKNVSKRRSAIYSNAGTLIFDENVEQYIKSVSLLSSTSDLRFTLISNKNDLCIGVSSVYRNNAIVKNFVKVLGESNVKMYINTEVC
jgi:hypothetical protein